MEGGRVHRLKPPFTQWPAMKMLGDLDSAAFAFKVAEAMGSELLSIGINVDFAPCVDVLTNPQNKVIGDRSFGSDPELVSKISSAMVRGYVKSGILPCAKHFPGHGNTLLDSHEDLPVEEKTLQELTDTELPPFKRAFRARLDLLMTAHILYSKIDPEWPATLSPKIIQEICRKDLGYRGIVMSDDLEMKALTKKWSHEVIAPQAFRAGCNILLYCWDISTPAKGLQAVIDAVNKNELDRALIDDSYNRVVSLKKSRLSKIEPLPYEEVKRLVGHPEHLSLAKSLRAGELPDDIQT
ncbi:MAG: glycoside hydrolase family 3 protein, partial [Bdellovibrionales bacterium]|nr:glycoside hydrolase family 3 protein [Bdellovibrionales bacterium]